MLSVPKSILIIRYHVTCDNVKHRFYKRVIFQKMEYVSTLICANLYCYEKTSRCVMNEVLYELYMCVCNIWKKKRWMRA